MFEFNSVGKGIAFFFIFSCPHQDCEKWPLFSVQIGNCKRRAAFRLETLCGNSLSAIRSTSTAHRQTCLGSGKHKICLERGLCWSICTLSKRRCFSVRRRRKLQQNIACARCHNTFHESLYSHFWGKKNTEDFRGVPVQRKIGEEKKNNFIFKFPFWEKSQNFGCKIGISRMKSKLRLKSKFHNLSINPENKVEVRIKVYVKLKLWSKSTWSWNSKIKVETSRIKWKGTAHKPGGVIPSSPVSCLRWLHSQNFDLNLKMEM